LGKLGALVGVVGGDDPDVGVVGAVRVGLGAITGEGDEMAVGGPGRVGIVVIAAGDLGQVFGGEIEDVDMGAATVKVADFVVLELQAVDDPGLFGFRFLVFSFGAFLFVFVFGFGFWRRLALLRKGREEPLRGGCCRVTMRSRRHLVACR